MSLVLQSSGGGQITIQEPTTASNFTQTLPAATGDVALLQTPSFATTIGVGGATPSTSGAGITFPATQSASTDANTLDDYEEGTWTPVVNGQNQPNCSYIKVGRLVTIAGDLTVTISSSTGDMTGLPFICTNGQFGNTITYNTSGSITSFLVTTGNSINLYNGQTTQQNFVTGRRYIFTVTYYSNS